MNKYLKMAFVLLATLSGAVASASFYQADQLPVKPQRIENALRSTFYLNVDDMDSHCSAFAISNDGYVLTNLHCLRSCFDNGYEFYKDDYYKATEKTDSFNIWEVKSHYPKNQICRNYTAFDNIHFSSEPRIVTLGKGKGAFEETKLSEISKSIFDKIIKVSEDYAILKYDQVSDQPCLKLSPAEKLAHKNLWLIGYPKKSNRQDGFDSDGLHQYISMGIHRKTIKDDPYLKTIFTKSKEWAMESAMYDQQRFLLSDLDVLGGNSGGPIINSEGQLVALLFAKVMPNTEKYEKTTAIGLKAKAIYSSVVKKFGSKKTRQIFNCRDL